MQKPFPKTKCLKFTKEVRAGRVFYNVSNRYDEIHLGLLSNRTGRWYFLATENRFNPEQLQSIARVCKWLEENEANNKNIKINKMDSFKCQGECQNEDRCFGDVRLVSVSGNGFEKPFRFNYCQEAREEDERRGFLVEEINEDLVKNEPDTQNTIPKNPS